MKAVVSFDSWESKFTAEQRDKLESAVIWPKLTWNDEKDGFRTLSYSSQEVILDVRQLNGLPKAHILKVIDDSGPLEQLELAITKLKEVVAGISFNSKCNVAVGGQNLMDIKNVTVRENCCTDLLQADLNEGWKILAVCVQPDGKRPDYVLCK